MKDSEIKPASVPSKARESRLCFSRKVANGFVDSGLGHERTWWPGPLHGLFALVEPDPDTMRAHRDDAQNRGWGVGSAVPLPGRFDVESHKPLHSCDDSATNTTPIYNIRGSN